jgi:hypothetical protein
MAKLIIGWQRGFRILERLRKVTRMPRERLN